MEFEAIPGVGEKTAKSLSELDDAERALAAGDVAALARAPGLTEGRAAAIARGAIRRRHGDDGGFLATDRARDVYRDVLSLLRERTVTTYAEKRLETLFPTASESRIEEVRGFAETAMERDPDPAVLDALDGVESLEPASGIRVRERCLATADAERYAAAKDAFPELSVEVVEDARGLAELARSYATVVALDEEFAGVVVEKYLALLVPILAVNVVMPFVVYGGLLVVGETIAVLPLFAVHLLSIPYLLACAGIGLLLSVLTSRASVAQRGGIGVVFGLFLIDTVTVDTDFEWLGALSPTNYYSPVDILTENTYDLAGALVLLSAAVVLVALSVAHFERRDV